MGAGCVMLGMRMTIDFDKKIQVLYKQQTNGIL
jgi:hypothetical protein